jgi:hypothetical protein
MGSLTIEPELQVRIAASAPESRNAMRQLSRAPSVMGQIAAVAVAGPLLLAGLMIAIARPDVVLDGDSALNEMALMRSADFAQLIGNYSRFGWNHPGPSWYYAMDPVYLGLGARSWSFYVAVLTFHAVVGSLIVMSTWHRGGPLLALITSGLLLVYMRAVGEETFRDLWPPFLPILPIVLFFLLGAAGAAGSPSAMVGAFLAGSFAVQTHVSTAPVVVSVLAAMAGIRIGRSLLFGGSAGTIPRHRWTLALTVGGLFLLMLMWSPVVIEELTGRPGNLTKLWWFFTAPHEQHPYREGLSALGRQLQVYPFGQLPGLGEANFSTLPPGRVAAIAAFGTAAGGLVVGAIRLHDRFLQALAVLLIVAAPVTVLGISRIVGPMYSYIFIWATAYPLLLAIGWAALFVRAHPWTFWRRPAATYVLPAAALGLTVAVVALAAGRFESLQQLRSPAAQQADSDTRAVLGMLDGALGTESPQPLLMKVVDHDKWPVAAGAALALTKRAWTVNVSEGWVFMFGERSRSTGAESLELVVASSQSADRIRHDMPDLRPIGNTQDTYLFVRQVPGGR